MKESQFEKMFLEKAEIFFGGKSVAIEFKVTKRKTFDLKSWGSRHPHQLDAMFDAHEKGVAHKITDTSTGEKPFDAIFIREVFLVILYSGQEKFGIFSLKDIAKKFRNKETDLSLCETKKAYYLSKIK